MRKFNALRLSTVYWWAG